MHKSKYKCLKYAFIIDKRFKINIKMCINLFTNSVGPIFVVLYLSTHFKFRLYTEMGKFQKKSILDTDKIFLIIYIIDTATDIFRNFIIDTDTDTGI